MRISKSMIKSGLAAFVLLLSVTPAASRTCFLPDSEDCGQGDGGVSDISDVGSCRYYTCKDAGYKNDNPYQECYVENTVNIKNNRVSCYAVRCKMSQTACEEKAEGTNKCCNRDVASGCYYVGTCPKDCDRSIYSYDSEQTGDGWTCISCHDGKGTFYKCNYDKTCEEQGYATSCSDEQIAEEVTSAKGQNGEKCYTCKGKPLSCPDGYSTTVKTCASGYKLETNGAIEGAACGKCVEEGCPSGYATSTTSCPSGYTLETNGKSGSKTCGKCVKDTPVNYCGDGYCIEFRFLCNGETCSNEVLKNISVSVDDDDWSLTNYTYYNSSVYDGQTVNIEVRIDEEADVYIENLEENIINVPDAGIEYNISDTEYREAIVYEELNKTISSASAFECEENETSETCLERYGAVADSCSFGNDSVCNQLETATKHITRTFNLYVPSGETRCIYYAATCPHLPQNGKLFQSDTSGTSGLVSQYYSWKEGSSSSSSSLDSVYGSSDIKGYNQYGQFASDCIKEAYIVTSNGRYELEQMSQDTITDAFNKAKGDEIEFFNLDKDTVILSNCKLKDTDQGTLYVYPNTDYQEFYKNGNTLFPSVQGVASSHYDVENQTVKFTFYKTVNYCDTVKTLGSNPPKLYVSTIETTPEISAQYTSRGGYIFNTTGEGACISVGKDSQSVNIYGCHKTYPISWQTRMIQDKIYPYSEVSGKYERALYRYTHDKFAAGFKTEETSMGGLEYLTLTSTRPLPKLVKSVWYSDLNITGSNDEYFNSHNTRFPYNFEKGDGKIYEVVKGSENLVILCSEMSLYTDGTAEKLEQQSRNLFDFGIEVVDDYVLISRESN